MAEVNNQDIVFLSDKLYRMIEEAELCASANVAVLSDADNERFVEYNESITEAIDWIQAQPNLDLPETHPMVWAAKDPPEQIDVENEGINQYSRLLRVTQFELVHSQSARIAVRLLPKDENRFRANIEKAQAFIDNYLSQQDALDLPESSPQEPVAPPGKTGTKQRAK